MTGLGSLRGIRRRGGSGGDPTRSALVLVGALSVALLIGCTPGAGTRTTPSTAGASPTADVTSPAEAGPKTVTKTVTSTRTATGARAERTVPAAALDWPMVKSPSGNILCVLDEDGLGEPVLECLVSDFDFAPIPRPQDCDGDFADGYFYLISGEPERGRCATDVSAVVAYEYEGRLRTLDYGRTTHVDPFACTSAEEGMTCWDVDTGRGFTLARAEATIF